MNDMRRRHQRRHGRGHLHERVYRREWDADRRRQAAELDRAERLWHITWSLEHRVLTAYALFDIGDQARIVSAPDPARLTAAMREAERPGIDPGSGAVTPPSSL
ncbi:hypothetical protein [Actinomadura litoris]|uniref:Uncharacterized protein n=1 Tax=Actinomadura litoris TaxID=2678616 RepID=A0A7K1KTM6_9ACTN|nr:hypothetical protein [Actinomadura litoris]MUN35385.1 hypothetical protein [Actinomadura litoris]